MDQINLRFELQGHKLSDWPSIRISFNGDEIWKDKVQDSISLEFLCNVSDKNVIEIEHFDKNDDVLIDDAGNLLDDRHCLVKWIVVNGIAMDLNFLSEYQFEFENLQGKRFITNYLGENGVLRIPFEYPLWKFWNSLQTKVASYPK